MHASMQQRVSVPFIKLQRGANTVDESRWYALLDGPHQDQVPLKKAFAASEFDLDVIDEKLAVSAPPFAQCTSYEDALDEATALLASVNISLRVSQRRYVGRWREELAKLHVTPPMVPTMPTWLAAARYDYVAPSGKPSS
jgi:hypothetical protein